MKAKPSTFEQLQAAMVAGDPKAIDRLTKKFAQERGVANSAPKKAKSKIIIPGENPPPAPLPKSGYVATPPHSVETRTLATGREPFENHWEDPGDVDDGQAEQVDSQNGRKEKRITRRNAVPRVRIDCDGCHKPFDIFVTEQTARINEKNQVERGYRCNDCSVQGPKGGED